MALLFLGCAHNEASNTPNERSAASEANAHKTEKSGMDTYYIHDGEKHMVHGAHIDSK